MYIKDTLYLEFVETRKDFRQWLYNNCCEKTSCFVGIKAGKPKEDGSLYYLDAVEEGLCFGWIDSVFKKINGRLVIRFSKRRKNSHWTELNKERARRLIKLKRMTKYGEVSLPDLEKEFVIDDYIIKILKKDELVWNNFLQLPKLYVRVRIDNIQSLKIRKDNELFCKRLKKFVEATKKGIIYGAWNDYGRLS